MTTTSRTRDRVATLMAALFALAEVVLVFLLVVFATSGRPLVAAAYAVLVLALGIQLVAWVHLADARVTVSADGVCRAGLSGWRLSRDQVAGAVVKDVRGRPHLVVTPATPRRSRTTLALGSEVPRGSLVAPLDPAAVEQMRAAVATL